MTLIIDQDTARWIVAASVMVIVLILGESIGEAVERRRHSKKSRP